MKRFELEEIDFIVVDSYVLLNDTGKLGLGGHLYEYLDKGITVIGVAKSSFNSNKINCRELLRGKSIKPLYISAIGIELEKTVGFIKKMYGEF